MSISVKDIVAGLEVLAGRPGLKRVVTSPQIMVPELSSQMEGKGWASSVIYIRPSQNAYLCSLPRYERVRLVQTITAHKPACLVVNSSGICKELLEKANSLRIPVLKTGNLPHLTRLLIEKLSPQASLHGVLVQIFGLGTLIIGKSAVGKSEAALDLLLRGHKLVADDVVVLEKTNHEIIGRPIDIGSDLLQIRGLGIINIRALYGESATVKSCKVGVVVELEEWQTGRQYSLIGLRERRYRLMGINLPYLKLAVKPGRNMATLVEVAAKNQLLKQRGVFSARDVNKKLKKRLVR
jgi:HPr kinase/phosphorylase